MNILLASVHTAYLYSLAQTGHEFYCVEDLPEDIPWEAWNDRARPRPPNVHCFPYSEVGDRSFDVLILQAPGQWLERRRFPSLPTIYVEHNAQPHFVPHYLTDKGTMVIFNSLRTQNSYARREGITYRTIEVGVLGEFSPFEGDEAVALTVVSKFKERDNWTRFSLWHKVIMGFPRKVVGFGDPGLSEQAASWDSLRAEYCHNRVYLSVGIAFPGLSEVEAAMSGMPLVRVKGAGEIVKARGLLKHYLEDKEAAVSDGLKWREWALEHYNIERVCSEWNEVLNLAQKGEVK